MLRPGSQRRWARRRWARRRWALRTPQHTVQLGAAVGAHLREGDWVVLFGPIGAGKTTFVQGITSGIGSERRATSPSFVLVHHYPGVPPLLHVDLYRVGDQAEFEDLAVAEQAEQYGAAIAVEWPNGFSGALPADRLEVHLSFCASGALGNEGRMAEVVARGSRGNALLQELENYDASNRDL